MSLNARSKRENYERNLYDGKRPEEQVYPSLQRRPMVVVDGACSKEGQLK